MRVKNRIHIFFAIVLLATLISPPPMVAEVGRGGALASFSGHWELRAAIWRLAAFGFGWDGDGDSTQTIKVEGIKGLPPVAISLTFGKPLDPWPESLSLRFVAEEGEVPVVFTITDRRPFGGANITFTGLEDNSQAPVDILINTIDGINQRLMSGKPHLGPLKWRSISQGFDITRIKILYGARLGPDDLFISRFDPNHYTFMPYHESEYPKEPQVDIRGWSKRLPRAVSLINGGQYYPDRTYMGRLMRKGRKISTKAHPQWKGYVVSHPNSSAPPQAPASTIIDVDNPTSLTPDNYHNILQSFMLFDERGHIRVQNSYKLAGRAAIGEDHKGNMFLIMTPAAISIYDLAVVLKSPSLGLKKAVSLDGGFETQLLLWEQDLPFLSTGQFAISENKAIYLPGYHPSLPSVLAVVPRLGRGP